MKPGCSDNPVLGGWDRYWDVNCFQLPAVNTRGNLGRNTLIGPGLVSIDASLVKSFALGGGRTLQVRIEAFNLPNRPELRGSVGAHRLHGRGRRRLARDRRRRGAASRRRALKRRSLACTRRLPLAGLAKLARLVTLNTSTNASITRVPPSLIL